MSYKCNQKWISTDRSFWIFKIVNEGRRRHRQRMFPVMIFGMAALGVVIIPIGFHIMTVISGTALLFAKMALLVASITGSKRVNSSYWIAYRRMQLTRIAPHFSFFSAASTTGCPLWSSSRSLLRTSMGATRRIL